MRFDPVQWVRDHPVTTDAAFGAVIGAISIAGLIGTRAATVGTSNRAPDPIAYLCVTAACFAVARRRQRPVLATYLGVAAVVPYWIRDYVDTGVSFAVMVLLYSVAANVDRPRSLRVGLCSASVLLPVMVVGFFVEEENLPLFALVGNSLIFAIAWTVGDSTRNRRRYLTEVEARAEAAERDREATAARAVQDERVRIARELHDVVAHSVSVMVVQDGAGRRVLDRYPDQAAESLSAIESVGRNALTELRRVLGVLRDDGATAGNEPDAPQPTATDLATLVDQFRDAGLSVGLVIDGELGELDDGVGLTVYRVVQEGLTNVLKHGGAQAAVRVDIGDRALTIAVDDDGDPTGAGVADDGSAPTGMPSGGQGLIGMRERVELFGGQLEAGARPGGGFALKASLPRVAVRS